MTAVGHCSVSRWAPGGSSSNVQLPKNERTVEPCALRLALPRWRQLHISSILAIVSFFRSLRPGHIWASLSAENISTRFCFQPHSCRPHAICKQACSALLTTCFFGFAQGSYIHLSKKEKVILVAVVEICTVSIRDPWFGFPGLQEKRATHDPQIAQIAQSNTTFRLLDKARAGHLMRTQARELALEQEPSPQTWPCRR